MVYEVRKEGFLISTNPVLLDAIAIHQYLSEESYWAQGVPFETVEKALNNSLCFGVYDGEKQIGLARLVTDRVTFAYLCDVYIKPAYQGNGLGKWLMGLSRPKKSLHVCWLIL